MTTKRTGRVLVEPGIYRRGTTFEIRVGYRDPATGERRERWRTVGSSKRTARAALVEARAAAQHRTMVSKGGGESHSGDLPAGPFPALR
jgi:hypothetical protein